MPEHPPRRYLIEKDGYWTEPTDYLRGGTGAEQEAQIAAREKQRREDAAAQMAWEAKARREYEGSRDSDTPNI